MVSKMGSGEKQVPLDHCPYIEQFTEGAVTCEELRPDQADYFALIREQAARRQPFLVDTNSSEGVHARNPLAPG